jgi:hypothetical protein
MKKIYLLLLLFTSPLITQAQPYFNNGAKWLYNFYPSDSTDYIQIEKVGETWMAGKYCDELKFSQYYFPQGPNPTVNYRYTYFSGDTVYIYNGGMGVFGPLYNFNLGPGDTIYCIWCSGPMVIESVNQELVGTQSLETQYYTAGPTILKTFEKIGNTGYFIPDFSNQSPMSQGWHLRCYQDSTGLNYYDGYSDCTALAAIEAHENISISAMYFNGTLSCSEIKPGSEISIYDMQGNLVDSEIATQPTTCSIELSVQSQAIYCVRIRNGNEFYSEKIMVLNPD